MPKLILGLTGQAGCGKGTVVEYLRSKYNIDYFRFSGLLGDILTRLNIEKTRDNFIKLSEALRHEFGEDALSYAIERDAVSSPNEIVVIDGIRRPEDIVALEPLPNFKLLSIEVPAKIRYERMTHRGEKKGENEMTWKQFQQEEKAPTEITIPTVMKRAWKTLTNEGTPEEFNAKIGGLMEELGFNIKK